MTLDTKSKEQKMPIEERIKTLIIEQLRVGGEDVERDATFADLGADSLDLAELLMCFEQTFGVRIPPDSARELRSVGSAIDYIVGATSDER
ncbi:MAG: acyl carrier protein [Polyangiaceae bacterium]|jgi:acyl carrier protein|nr:acyl carrier protein [Polyangiaceae bacterium]